MFAAGSPAGACAWRWLQEQSATVTCICGLVVNADAERLSSLLTNLPVLASISELGAVSGLTLRPHPGAAVAATQDFLAGAARAIGCCACLRRLDLLIDLGDMRADQVPGTVWHYLARARALEDLDLSIRSGAADTHDRPATACEPQVIAGLVGLSRLRTLALELDTAYENATLPACVSRLAQLTSLRLSGLRGLRGAPGWARLPALVCLDFEDCVFTRDGEAALPGMDALASLFSLRVWQCPSLRTLPTSLWILTQLRQLEHWSCLLAPQRDEPVSSLPAGAPCFAFLDRLTLSYDLPTWPTCVLAMTHLTHLNLSGSCFEQVPESLSALTALDTLCLGWDPPSLDEIGGALDACALGNLAGFPALRSLNFDYCSVLFSPSFQAAAAHPRLKTVVLLTSYPALGSSCGAFLGFVTALLQQGRAGVLRLQGSVVRGAGEHDGQSFRGALQAVGFALADDDDDDGARSVAEDEYITDTE